MGLRNFPIYWVYKYSVHFHTCTDLIMLLYNFLVISFEWYKESRICLISFNILPELLPAFACARGIGNLRSIYLGVNILSPSPYFVLYLPSDSKKE